MEATLPIRRSNKKSNRLTTEFPSSHGPAYSAEELQAFLAARNLILRGAEENTTELNLRRAAAANEFTEACLKPAAPVAETIAPEVRVRLAQLRVRLRRPAA